MAETQGGVVVIKFKADTTDLEKAKKTISNFNKQELAQERNELARQRNELAKQRNEINAINAATKAKVAEIRREEAITKRIKADNDALKNKANERLATERNRLAAERNGIAQQRAGIAALNAQTKQYDAHTKRIKVDNDRINQAIKNRIATEKLNLQAQKQQNSMYKKMNASAGKLNTTIKAIGSQLLAFASIAAIVNFAKACVTASSDVVEIQNVVDNAFPSMSKEIDDWAKNSVKQFGMAQAEAKKYASMFGLISRSAGLAEKDAYKLGTNLTALTADIGSMLNMKNEEVFTKLRSGVLSGETESIKQLGISMTETDVQAWLMSKGINENYRQMTQAQKIAVRYNYVLEKTNLMQGDFARNQGTWANQTKQLDANIKGLQANLGTFLRTALLPLLQVLNKIIEAANNATIAFKNFLSKTFNIKFDNTGISEGTEAIEEGLGGVEESANDAATAIKKTLGPLDQLNILGEKNSGSKTAGVGGAIMDLGDVETKDTGGDLNQKNELLGKIAEKAKEIATSFKSGWDMDFDPTKWDRVKDSLSGIKKTITEIATSDETKNAMNDYANRMANSFGRISASVANIGGSIAVNVMEGMNRALANHKDEIQTTLVETLDLKARQGEITAKASEAVATIASTLESEGSIRITSALDGILISAGSTITRLYERLKTDILDMLVKPLADNAEKFKETFDTIQEYLAPMFESVESFVTETGQGLVDMYDQHFSPMFQAIGEFLSEMTSFYNDVLKIFVDKYLAQISEWFTDFTENKLKPLWANITEMFGEIADAIKNALPIIEPILKIIMGLLAAIVSVVLDILIPVIENVINVAVDVIDGIIVAIKGSLKVINGLITGDFAKVIEGIVDIVGGVMERIAGVVDGVINTIVDAINNLFNTSFSHSNLVGFVKNLVSSLIGSVKGEKSSETSGKTSSKSSGVHKYANGGAFLPGHEVLGILGDNKHEKEYALTESHLDDIARRTASILQGGQPAQVAGVGNINLQIQMDGEWLDARILKVSETNDFRG